MNILYVSCSLNILFVILYPVHTYKACSEGMFVCVCFLFVWRKEQRDEIVNFVTIFKIFVGHHVSVQNTLYISWFITGHECQHGSRGWQNSPGTVEGPKIFIAGSFSQWICSKWRGGLWEAPYLEESIFQIYTIRKWGKFDVQFCNSECG